MLLLLSRFAKFTFLGHLEITPISDFEFDNRRPPNPYNIPLTYNKKYAIIGKNNVGFAILDDYGVRREFIWGAPHFKITSR